MHYTSIENIHKVIDPLFLNDLKEELEDIKSDPIQKNRARRAYSYQEKLAGLKFLDPACGSGNFLTETYLSLRRLENEAIQIQSRDNGPSLGADEQGKTSCGWRPFLPSPGLLSRTNPILRISIFPIQVYIGLR